MSKELGSIRQICPKCISYWITDHVSACPICKTKLVLLPYVKETNEQ